MKKRFSIMALALVAAFGFTACHDDDSEDENSATVSNFNQSATIGQSIFDNVTSKANITTCYFTDENNIADFYTFSAIGVGDIAAMGTMNADGKTVTLGQQGLTTYGEGIETEEEYITAFAGGFCPTWFAATDNTPFAPACGHFQGSSNNGALLCNPGMLLKAFFSRHMSMDLSSLMSAIKKLKINSLYVCPTDAYKYIGMSDDDTPYDYEGYASEALPADHEIQFVVYGYVNSFSIGNIQSALSSLKGAASSVAGGGTLCAHPIVLAETDSNGKLKVNTEWQKMDLTDLKDYYLFEACIRVIDKTTGKTSEKYEIGSQVANAADEEATSSNDALSNVLISDIAFTGRSFF